MQNYKRFLLLMVGFVAFATLFPGNAIAATAGGAHKIFQWRPFLGPFHAVVLHFPIGFLTMAFILELYRLKHPSEELKRVTVLVIWLSLFSGIVAAALGIMRAAEGGYDMKAVEHHRIEGMSVPVLTLLTIVFQRFAYRGAARSGWNYSYQLLLCCTMVLLVMAGHHGGNLTHGSKYLTENAPQIVRDLLEDEPSSTNDLTTMPGAGNEKVRYYVERVRPILIAKCLSCHCEEKHKGGLRLDRSEFAFKGGDSGKPAIKPGEPLTSRLVQFITLPPGHDDIMPPSGKEPLTPEEIGVIVQWIRIGAPFAEAPSPTPPPPPAPSTSEVPAEQKPDTNTPPSRP